MIGGARAFRVLRTMPNISIAASRYVVQKHSQLAAGRRGMPGRAIRRGAPVEAGPAQGQPCVVSWAVGRKVGRGGARARASGEQGVRCGVCVPWACRAPAARSQDRGCPLQRAARAAARWWARA